MKKIVFTPELTRQPIGELLPLALEDLANSFDLREEIAEEGMKLLRRYNLINLTDIDEFERSFFRTIYANLLGINFHNMEEEIQGIVCYTFDLSLNKDPILREALEKANKEEKCDVPCLLFFYTCQQFYQRMK